MAGDDRRGLVTDKITRFRGMNQYTNIADIGPEYAIDLLNVVISKSGELRKLRVPLAIAAAVPGALGVRCYGVWDFQQANGTRQIIGVYDTKVYRFDLVAGTWTPTLVDDNALNAAQWSAVESNNVLYMANGLRMMKWTGANFWKWGHDVPAAAPAITSTAVAGPLTFAVGRSYRAAFKNSVTGHEGSGSPASVSTGPVAAKQVTVKLNDPAIRAQLDADPQLDTIVWYATQDQGVEYFKHSEVAVTAGDQVLTDTTPDAGLDKLTRVCLINNPPPVGKYLVVQGGRIFVGYLDGSPQDIVYSGYEQVRNGRPEESFPPNNRLRLEIGADWIRGLGVVQSGVIAGSKSNELFMFRGEAEDVVVDDPISYSATLETLPYQTGIGSHYTMTKTPYGAHFLTANKTIDCYEGQADAPYTISDVINNIIKNIPIDKTEVCQAAFFNYLDKDWYVLGVPEPGTQFSMSKLIVFDLGSKDSDSGNLMGVFVFNVGFFQALAIVEDPTGRPMVVISQNGTLKEVRTFTDEVNGLPQAQEADDSGEELGAYYQPGYVGNETPNVKKMWRHMTVESTLAVTTQARLVDRDFTSPKFVETKPDDQVDGRSCINWKARRMSPGVIFPTKDANISVLSIVYGYIPLSDR